MDLNLDDAVQKLLLLPTERNLLRDSLYTIAMHVLTHPTGDSIPWISEKFIGAVFHSIIVTADHKCHYLSCRLLHAVLHPEDYLVVLTHLDILWNMWHHNEMASHWAKRILSRFAKCLQVQELTSSAPPLRALQAFCLQTHLDTNRMLDWPRFVSLVGAARSTDDARLHLWAARALEQLTGDTAHRPTLQHPCVTELLLHALSCYDHPDTALCEAVHEAAGKTLATLTSGDAVVRDTLLNTGHQKVLFRAAVHAYPEDGGLLRSMIPRVDAPTLEFLASSLAPRLTQALLSIASHLDRHPCPADELVAGILDLMHRHTGESDVQQHACSALQCILPFDPDLPVDTQRAITSHVLRALRAHQADPAIQRAGCGVIALASPDRSPDMAQSLIDAMGLGDVLFALREHPAAAADACFALLCLSATEADRNQAVAAGALELVKATMQAHRDDAAVQHAACKVLFPYCADKARAATLWNLFGHELKHVLQAFTDRDLEAHARATHIASDIVVQLALADGSVRREMETETQQAILMRAAAAVYPRDRGILCKMVESSAHSYFPNISSDVLALCIGALLRQPEITSYLHVSQLLQVVHESEDSQVHALLSTALAQTHAVQDLSWIGKLDQEFTFRYEHLPERLEACLRTHRLSPARIVDACRAIVRLGIPVDPMPLLDLLQEDHPAGVLHEICSCLAFLASDLETRHNLTESVLIPTVAAWLQGEMRSSGAFQHASLQLFSRLALDSQSHEALQQAGLLPFFLSSLEAPEPTLRSLAADTLLHIAPGDLLHRASLDEYLQAVFRAHPNDHGALLDYIQGAAPRGHATHAQARQLSQCYRHLSTDDHKAFAPLLRVMEQFPNDVEIQGDAVVALAAFPSGGWELAQEAISLLVTALERHGEQSPALLPLVFRAFAHLQKTYGLAGRTFHKRLGAMFATIVCRVLSKESLLACAQTLEDSTSWAPDFANRTAALSRDCIQWIVQAMQEHATDFELVSAAIAVLARLFHGAQYRPAFINAGCLDPWTRALEARKPIALELRCARSTMYLMNHILARDLHANASIRRWLMALVRSAIRLIPIDCGETLREILVNRLERNDPEIVSAFSYGLFPLCQHSFSVIYQSHQAIHLFRTSHPRSIDAQRESFLALSSTFMGYNDDPPLDFDWTSHVMTLCRDDPAFQQLACSYLYECAERPCSIVALPGIQMLLTEALCRHACVRNASSAAEALSMVLSMSPPQPGISANVVRALVAHGSLTEPRAHTAWVSLLSRLDLGADVEVTIHLARSSFVDQVARSLLAEPFVTGQPLTIKQYEASVFLLRLRDIEAVRPHLMRHQGRAMQRASMIAHCLGVNGREEGPSPSIAVLNAIRATCPCDFCTLPVELQAEICKSISPFVFAALQALSECWRIRNALFGGRGFFHWGEPSFGSSASIPRERPGNPFALLPVREIIHWGNRGDVLALTEEGDLVDETRRVLCTGIAQATAMVRARKQVNAITRQGAFVRVTIRGDQLAIQGYSGLPEGVQATQANEGHLVLGSDGIVYEWTPESALLAPVPRAPRGVRISSTNIIHAEGGGISYVRSRFGPRWEIPSGIQPSIDQLSTAHHNAVMLTCDGRVFVTGVEKYGTLGTFGDDYEWNVVTKEVRMPTHSRVVRVLAGDQCSFAQLENNEVYAWGENLGGQLGTGSQSWCPIPTRVLLPRAKPHHQVHLLVYGDRCVAYYA